MGKAYGYVRVSSIDQSEERQMIALSEVKVALKIFSWTSNQERILNGHSIKV